MRKHNEIRARRLLVKVVRPREQKPTPELIDKVRGWNAR